MATKAQVYAKLAEDTARKITASYLDWAAFLNTSSRLYKYPYNDQLLIYAQRPDATACAEYDLWNSAMRRYVRRGAKGIALLSPGANGMSVRYVFDVSDTGARQDSRSVEPWQISGQVEPSVRQMLEAVFDADAAMGLAAQLEQIASQQALSYWRDHRRDIIDSVDGSFLSEYDEFNIGASFRKAATASISYSLQTRCGLEPELLREDFTEVYDWNTPATVTELGQAVSMITGQVLRQIERTIRQTERSMEHERTDVQAERGLSSAQPGFDRSGTAALGQVQPAQTALSGAEPAGPVHAADAERQADGAPAGDRTDGAEPSLQPDGPAVQASGPDRSVESGEPDGLGQADERPESAGRGDDPLGADLRLTDHAPAVEQLSFLIPSETAQIQWLDTTEAESIPRMPFASLVSQKVIDEFLRSGGNTDDLRLHIGVDFMKQLPLDILAAHFAQDYRGGNGLVIDGKPYSAWYDASGIRIAPGRSARYVNSAQIISWRDAARRVGELMDAGQFLSMMELANCPIHERTELAQHLVYLYGDLAQEADGFFSSLKAIHSGSFPEAVSRLAGQLAEPRFLSALTEEVEQFSAAYAHNRALLRYHYHRPEQIAEALRELTLPRREYNSLLTQVAQPAAFITDDELDAALASGGLTVGSKLRIHAFFTQTHTSREQADFLKREYGTGGRSHAVSGASHSEESFDGKGIRWRKQNCEEIRLSWAQVASRLAEIIRLERDLTPEEKEHLAQREQAQQLADQPVPEQLSREEPDGDEHGNAQDDEEPIDTEALRSRLAEAGIVNGEVVDEDALNASPFIQEVQALASRMQELEDAARPDESVAAPDDRQSVDQTLANRIQALEDAALLDESVTAPDDRQSVDQALAGRMQVLEDTTPPDESMAAPDDRQSVDLALSCKVGDTVYLDDTPFVITQIGLFNVQLQDPSLRYPVLRSESRENFLRLLARDERNAAYLPESENTAHEGSPQPYPQGFPQNFAESVDKSVAPFVPANFRISDDHLGEGGAKVKFQRNMEAIHLLHRLEAGQRMATPQEQSVLSRYVGWGGLADAFDPEKAAWAREYRELSAALTPQEYEAARASTLNAHYTSPVVIRAMYDAVAQMGFTGGNILEPSMGVGNFFGLLPESMQDSRLYGVELDSITGRIARQLYPKADITVAGFETTDRRDFFDLAIGNVPFGNYKVNDRAYNKLGFSIHNYFFAKTLDQVRPGGVIAFVTSRYTMDQQSPEVRQYIAQRAELLGAIRLPNNAFRANAGTEVVSDILFLQRRDRPIDIEPDWVHVGENADGFTMNSYFIEHPEMVLGVLSRENTQYGRESFTVLPAEGADLADQLHEAIGHIHGVYREASLPDLGEGEALDASIPADPTVRNFSYTVVDGFVYYRENSRMVKPRLNQTAQERVKGLIALRDQVHRLIDAQLDEQGDEEIAQLQRELNTLYDGFSVRFGLINDRANRLAFAEDSSYYLLCSLEILDDEHRLLRKADMFTRRTIKQQHRVDHVDTASDALAVSIGERARVDLGFMAGLTGKSEEEIVQELRGVIFRIPDTEQYVTADEYLSGNVRQKLRDARAAAQADAAFGVNVSALEAAQPKDLEASDIDVRLGATWISQDYIQDFMYELLETPYYQRRVIEVHFSAHTAEWRINGKNVVSRTNVAAYTTYGTDRANAYKILEDTLNLRDVRIYDTIQDADGREQRVLNQKATTLAQQKQQAIKDAFREWIWKDPDRRQALVAQYNELFNSVRPREYDGRHIVFSGMNPEISLREHQRNAVAHILYGGNTLLAHQVGAGKTFEMVAAAMESKRLGLCQKSMFVVPNHLTEQWASEFLRLYPSARILVTTKKDFETSNRKKFCARIATGDYDAVIIGHSQFEKIPVSHERQERLLQEEIDEIMEGIEELKRENGERFSIKQLEKSKRQLETRLEKLRAEDRKDDVVTFEQLGVDRLYVDEAHAYKNLFLYTKMRNVAGISTSEAQKSSDMYLKCRYMDELTGGRGIIFATGTPVSNSMTELYTMQRYLQYGALQRSGMTHFDCWASTFGETTTAIELAPEGTGYRARTRFAKFFNLPELMNVFRQVADIKTADQLHLPTPQVHYETVVVKPTAQQQEMVQALSERAAAVHGKMVDPTVDNMLKITSDGRKLGLDQRLINPLLPDDPASKVNACVGNIVRIWESGQESRLTQLVFCDISTPKGAGLNPSPSSKELTDGLQPENDFNVYDDIRQKLVERGIPAEQIAFIHEANTEVKKKELFARVRSGQVRVLMGSTAKMGAGTNVQDRLIALHDLDCPWRPGDLEQRAGRIVRQGNMNPEVSIYRYVTEATFDAYLWQTVENKQKFISQIMTSKSPVRSCEDMDETALSYAEIKALCAGDPRIKEKMDLDVDVARLKLMRSDHLSKQFRLEDQLLKVFPQEVERDTHMIAGFEKDIATLNAHPLPQEDFVGMTVGDVLITDKEEAGKAILTACKEAARGTAVEFGSYRGLNMRVQYDSFVNRFLLTLHGAVSHPMEVGNDARGNITRLDNAIAQIPKRLAATEEHLATVRQQIEAAKAEVSKPFPQETELKTKSARLAELDAALNMDHTSSSRQADRPHREEER